MIITQNSNEYLHSQCEVNTCTGTDSNKCDTNTGACKCNTNAKCSGTLPYCINTRDSGAEKKGELAGAESKDGNPTCGVSFFTFSFHMKL